MTTSVLHHRRAERFAELLGQESGYGPRHRVRSRSDADLATLVRLTERAAAVRLKPSTDPDPGFRADLRAMLVATVEREGVPTAPPAPARPTRRRLLAGRGARARAAIVGGVAAGALVLSGIAAASGGALPGDTLYGVKRSTERAELAFAGSDTGRGQLHLEFARTRLDEAKSVSDSATHFQRTLDDMDSDIRQGVKLLATAAVERKDPAALDAVDTFVRGQQSDIGDILDTVGGDARARLLSSLDFLAQVATRAQQLRQTLTCGTARSAGSDALGPRPGSCPSTGSPVRTPPSEQTTARPSPSHGARGGTSPAAGPEPRKPAAVATSSGPANVPGTRPPTPTPAPTPSATPGDGDGLIDSLRRIVDGILGG